MIDALDKLKRFRVTRARASALSQVKRGAATGSSYALGQEGSPASQLVPHGTFDSPEEQQAFLSLLETIAALPLAQQDDVAEELAELRIDAGGWDVFMAFRRAYNDAKEDAAPGELAPADVKNLCDQLGQLMYLELTGQLVPGAGVVTAGESEEEGTTPPIVQHFIAQKERAMTRQQEQPAGVGGGPGLRLISPPQRGHSGVFASLSGLFGALEREHGLAQQAPAPDPAQQPAAAAPPAQPVPQGTYVPQPAAATPPGVTPIAQTLGAAGAPVAPQPQPAGPTMEQLAQLGAAYLAQMQGAAPATVDVQAAAPNPFAMAQGAPVYDPNAANGANAEVGTDELTRAFQAAMTPLMQNQAFLAQQILALAQGQQRPIVPGRGLADVEALAQALRQATPPDAGRTPFSGLPFPTAPSRR